MPELSTVIDELHFSCGFSRVYIFDEQAYDFFTSDANFVLNA